MLNYSSKSRFPPLFSWNFYVRFEINVLLYTVALKRTILQKLITGLFEVLKNTS